MSDLGRLSSRSVRNHVGRKSTLKLHLLTLFAIGLLSAPAFGVDDHLLLCEAVVTPTANEFIEIFNPTAGAIGLDNYYLSDDEDYALLPGASGTGPAPSIGSSDFIAQFPPGATIAPGGVVVVAFDGAGFLAAFGFAADYEIHGTDAGTPDMVATDVGSSTAGLTNSGENVVIFFWDGASDLVVDTDMTNIGTPSSTNDIGDKTGVSVDGPDADSDASTYLTDNFTMPQQAADPGSGASTKRVALETVNETTGGGNGMTGDDETTEQITTTFDAPPFSAPNPGVCSPSSATPSVLINEVDADQTSTDAAEFVELYDGGAGSTALDGLVLVLYNGSDDASYLAFDLDGQSTDADGYFVLCGDAANVANCDLDVSPNTNLIQNGADAVAIHVGNGSDFPNDTPVTTANLVDALVYDTNDSDDAGLSVLLNAGQPQVNEGGGGSSTGDSNQRCPNGTGGARNTDSYDQFSPTPGEENTCGTGGPPFGDCGDATLFIYEVQGSGLVSPYDGTAGVVLEGVVIGNFQASNELGGFFLQEEDIESDGDPTTSDGIFVFDNGFGPAVAVGDQVRVQGDVDEFFGLTELKNISNLTICSAGNPVPTAASMTLPVASVNDWEAAEGMLVTLSQTLYVTDNFNQGRFGEVWLSVGGPLDIPTNVVAPGAPALALQDLNNRSRIQLDDGSGVQNPLPLPPYIGSGDTLRTGDTIPGLTAALGFAFGSYELHPVGAVSFTRVNDRSGPPSVGGAVTVAAFNVLNYFTTLDGSGQICGPLGDQGCRGADDATEFSKQRAKLVAAITELDADVVGLIELENYPGDVPIADLVDGLNDAVGAGTYDFISTGAIGDDAIRVGLIYQPAAVLPAGPFAVLDSSVDAQFNDDKNRPVLAQSFEETSNGVVFTVAVNHLKSKGSPCDDVGDPNAGDGQGNCNGVRTAAAGALVSWLATDPTGSASSDFLIIGDLNSYAQEDPVTTIEAAGYFDLIEAFLGAGFGDGAYSFNFSGQSGYLDHALSSPSLTVSVTGADIWHINADEPRALDYNDFNQPALFSPDEFRSSDHDPVVVGLFGDSDDDGVLDPVDVCPGTSIPESVPTNSLGTNRWALMDDDGVFDTSPPNGNGPGDSFTIGDTGGCSCEQIIEAMDLGSGHEKFGCSTGEMREWVELVNP